MLRSVWRVWFVTYQGAFVMVLRIFDCALCYQETETKACSSLGFLCVLFHVWCYCLVYVLLCYFDVVILFLFAYL